MNFSINKITQKPLKRLQIQQMYIISLKNSNFSKTASQRQFKTFKFFKNKNIVQSNKQNIDSNRQSLQQYQKHELLSKNNNRKSHFNSLKKSLKSQRQTFRQTFRQSIRNSQRLSFAPTSQTSKNSGIFTPKIKSDIIKRHQKDRKTHYTNRPMSNVAINNYVNEDKLGLERLLKKNKIPGDRCLIGMNIPKIQQNYQFSRFELFNLYTYYKTLLQSTNRSVKQLRKGFESILYMNKIQLNSQMINKMFESFFMEISFNNFIKVYSNIQNLIFTQTIIQFMITVFSQFYRQQELSSEKILQTLKQKTDESEAMQIRKLIYGHYNRKQQEKVKVKQILKACHENINICKRILNTMNKQPIGKK